MGTSFYLRDSILDDAGLDSTLFAGRSRSRTLPGGAPKTYDTTIRSLHLSAGAALASIAGTGVGTAAHQDNLVGTWVSAPLASQALAGGTWTFAAGVLQSGAFAQANSFYALAVYLYRAWQGFGENGIVIPIYDFDTPLGAEWPITDPQGRVVTFAGAGVPDVTWNDRLVLEVWRHAKQDTGGVFTNTVYFNAATEVVEGSVQPGIDGDPASALTAPSTLTFAATLDPNAQTSQAGGGRAQGRGSIEERWYFCARCSRQYPESKTVILRVPHTSAGVRVCTQYCLDEDDYEMNQFGWTPRIEHDPPEEA